MNETRRGAEFAQSQGRASLLLWALTLFLLAIPLTLPKPGQPPNLKADEPAYYLMALSLAYDRDLTLDIGDVGRAFDEFPYGPIQNLVVATDDGWHTTYFGKPHAYSILAAPFAFFWQADGLLFFNTLLFVLAFWMGASYLTAQGLNPVLSSLFSVGFFVASSAFAYIFWLQPEMLGIAALTASLFFALHPRSVAVTRSGWWRIAPIVSGFVLALGAFHKPMLVFFALPPFLLWIRDRRWGSPLLWISGFALCGSLLVGSSWMMTGHPTAYLGVERMGVRLCSPNQMPVTPRPPSIAQESSNGSDPASTITDGSKAVRSEGATETPPNEAVNSSPTGGGLSWLLAWPTQPFPQLMQNLGYFLWGRHTGILLYMPFGVLAFVLFLIHGRDSWIGWSLVASIAAYALYLLLFIGNNWQGGGGFIGNRYFVNAYPAFLFLVPAFKPRWLLKAAFAWSGLFLGTIILTSLGQSVPEPTLQAHTRGLPFQVFPVELGLKQLPGYHRLPVGDTRIMARKDQVLPQGEALWIAAGDKVEMFQRVAGPLDKMVYRVRSTAASNRVTLKVGDHRQDLVFEEAGIQEVSFDPGSPSRRWKYEQPMEIYPIQIRVERGVPRTWIRSFPPTPCAFFPRSSDRMEVFPFGIELVYMGDGEPIPEDLFDLRWGQIVVPDRVVAGREFEIGTRLFNESRHTWKGQGAASIKLSYHWLDEAGIVVEFDGLRTPLPHAVKPGNRLALRQKIQAPEAPGRYILELDPVYEHVAWFSQKNNGKTFRREVWVDPLGAE